MASKIASARPRAPLSARSRRCASSSTRLAAVAETPSGASTNAGKTSELSVAVFSADPYVKDFLEEPMKASFPNTTFIDARLSTATSPLAAGHDAVCLFVNDNGKEEIIDTLADAGVKYIAMRCAGFDRIDLEACERRGVRIARVPAYSPYAVAEHAVALLQTLNRSTHVAHNRIKSGNFMLSGMVGMDLYGKTAGVIGTGKIGAILCNILNGFGMKLLCHDISENPEVVALGAEYVSKEELMARSDVISLHAPLLPSTYHMIDEKAIDAMKPGCILINVSRGGLIDTDALIGGLKSGKVGGACLDVYEHEGGIFFRDYSARSMKARMSSMDNTFALLDSYPNTLITPHSAFLTQEALDNIARTTIANLWEMTNGEDLTNEVKVRK